MPREGGRWESQDEGHHAHVPGGSDGEVPSRGLGAASQTNEGTADEDASREHASQREREGVLRFLQAVQVQRGERVLPDVGNAGSCGQSATLTGSGTAGSMGPSPQAGNQSRWSRLGQWGSRAFSYLASASRSASDGESQGEGRDPEAPEDFEDPTNPRRDQQFLDGFRTGADPGRGDRGHGESSSNDEGSERGRGLEDAEEEDRRGRVQHSKTRVKKRAYWQKLKELQEMKRKMKTGAHTGYVTENVNVLKNDITTEETFDVEEIFDHEEPFDSQNAEVSEDDDASDPIDLDEYETDLETGYPKVKLYYPDDFDEVKNLPSRRMKRNRRKRVKGLVHRALACLATTLVAFSTPVVAELEETILEPAKDLCKAILGPNTFQGKPEDFALLELFAGSAKLTTEFAHQGPNVLEPRDIMLGHDLFDQYQQESVFNDINYRKPKLLWVALPCTKWSQWQRLNYAQRRQQLRRERQKQRRLIHFAVECAWNQIANGGEVMFEHPRFSEMWDDHSMSSLMETNFMVYSDIDMCRYDLRAVTDGGRLRKPTRIVASDPKLLTALDRSCHGGHHHTPTEGRNTKAAGIYTSAFCRAVVQGFDHQRRSIWASETDASNKTWNALVAEGGAPPEADDYVEHKMTGIELPGHVPIPLARALRRIHQNLGHPSNHDLARHLKLSGANEAAVKAAQSIRCSSCARLSNPATRRPAKLVRPLEFNQEVAVDTLNLYLDGHEKVEILSVLDLATGYHVVKRLNGRLSVDLLKTFTDCWLGWAGPPLRLSCDLERGFLKEFTDGVEMGGTHVKYIAGQAHWQAGATERQGEWFRAMWDRTVKHSLPSIEEVDYTLAMVAAAKNNLRRKHGYSPAQWLFGSQPRTGDAFLDEEDSLYQREELRSPDELWRRKQTIRQAARQSFIQTQADDALKRAVLGRPRTNNEIFEQGDYVYIFRVDKTTGGKARHRQNAGEWIGAGVVVGKEGASYWVSRGGRCILCAAEHLRPAESEELGTAFQTKAVKDDLMRLAHRLEDSEDEDIFADATAPMHAKRIVNYDTVPERRVRTKGTVRMHKRPVPPGGAEQGARERPLPPVPDDDFEALVDKEVEEAGTPAPARQALVAERRTPRSVIKQVDKEIRWDDIPEKERHLYVEAEAKQWEEHIKYEAVRVHPPEDAELLRAKVHPNRILNARFAYRDKHAAKRREDSTVGPKAKARLCVGGHRDPDLRHGMINTEAPTASRCSLITLLFLAAQFGWQLAAGDVEAAFLNGVEFKRGLYFEVPKRGLPGVPAGSLVEIVKGVFGLSNSPRLWWDKLAKELCNMKIIVDGVELRLSHHEFDPCFLPLRDPHGGLRGALITHVDDLLVAAPHAEMEQLQQALSTIFPISEWEAGTFDYTGATIKQTKEAIELHQTSYVNSRLETVEIPKGVDPDDLADQVTLQDNMSTVGALSWLSSQTRPDLQAGVSLAQRRQKTPTYEDVKATNRLVKMAQSAKEEPLRFVKIAENLADLVLMVCHDAAWANAPFDPEVDDLADVAAAHGQGVYSQLGHLLVMSSKAAIDGKQCPTAVVGWRSHACPRVCRSTFAAETMAGLEGWEEALTFRSFIAGALHADPARAQEDCARQLFPIVSLTDCKSLYDNVHRVGGPCAPSEKRLVVDLTALRAMVNAEANYWGHLIPGGKTLRWLPTGDQWADVLTKVIHDVRSWWRNLRVTNLPFSSEQAQQRI